MSNRFVYNKNYTYIKPYKADFLICKFLLCRLAITPTYRSRSNRFVSKSMGIGIMPVKGFTSLDPAK